MATGRIGYVLPLNSASDFDVSLPGALTCSDGNCAPLDDIDTDLKLPLTERYFLWGLGRFQLRGYRARSILYACIYDEHR